MEKKHKILRGTISAFPGALYLILKDGFPRHAFQEVARLQAAELQVSATDELLLAIELPAFPAAVLYQQQLSAAAVVIQGSRREAAAAAAAVAGGSGGFDPSVGLQGLVLVQDPEVWVKGFVRHAEVGFRVL
jgi:hypothetical protein